MKKQDIMTMAIIAGTTFPILGVVCIAVYVAAETGKRLIKPNKDE